MISPDIVEASLVRAIMGDFEALRRGDELDMQLLHESLHRSFNLFQVAVLEMAAELAEQNPKDAAKAIRKHISLTEGV